MTGGDAVDLLFEELDLLRRAAGSPPYSRIESHAKIDGKQISTSSMSNLVKRTTKPRPDTVLAFVVGCEGYARSKGIQLPPHLRDHARWEELVDAARKLDTEAYPPAVAPPEFEQNYLPPWAWKRIRQLMSTLQDSICEDHVRRLLWSAVDEIGPLTVAGPCEIMAVLRGLDAGFVPLGSLPPALVLLEYLAATQHVAVRRSIQLLIDGVGAAIGVSDSEVNRVRTRAAAPFRDEHPVSVFIKVEGAAEPGYRLTAWLYRPDKPLTFKCEGGGCSSTQQLRAAVEDLIGQIAPLARGLPFPQLQFEFALPWDLLSEAVEQWCLSDGRPIGQLSSVVVRSTDRMQDPWAAAQWQRRSGLLSRCDLAADDLVAAGTSHHGLYELGEASVCVVAHGPYLAPPRWQDEDPLLAAIKDGLPAAIWHRDGGDPQELVDLIYTTVNGTGLMQLPAALQRLRSARHSGEGSAPSICLLWDDYYRQPEPPTRLSWPPRAVEGDEL